MGRARRIPWRLKWLFESFSVSRFSTLNRCSFLEGRLYSLKAIFKERKEPNKMLIRAIKSGSFY